METEFFSLVYSASFAGELSLLGENTGYIEGRLRGIYSFLNAIFLASLRVSYWFFFNSAPPHWPQTPFSFRNQCL